MELGIEYGQDSTEYSTTAIAWDDRGISFDFELLAPGVPLVTRQEGRGLQD